MTCTLWKWTIAAILTATCVLISLSASAQGSLPVFVTNWADNPAPTATQGTTNVAGTGDQAPKQSTRHVPVVEDLVQLLQARPDLRTALEGAIRTADLNGLRDMDSFLTYLDGLVTFVPTAQ